MSSENLQSKKLLLIFGSVIFSTVAMFAILYILFFAGTINAQTSKTSKNNTQVVEIIAKNGFRPAVSYIEPNKSIQLRIDTHGTYDCSSTISIPKLNINDTLPATGVKEYTIPPQTAGTVIDATCSMGMYSFKIIARS